MLDPVYSLHLKVRVRTATERRAERRRRIAVLTVVLVAGASALSLLVRASQPISPTAAARVAPPPAVEASADVRSVQVSAPEPPAPLQPPRLDERLPASAALPAVQAAEVAAPAPSVRIAAVGDITPGSTPTLPPDGGAELFTAVSPLLDGDVVVGNLEAVLTERPSSKCPAQSSGCFAFLVPPSYAGLLAEGGFTVLNLANNHSLDAGEAGAADTVRELVAHGIRATGIKGEIAYEDVGGIQVAVAGFAPYLWANDLLDLEAATELVREASERADIVVVVMHAGAEGRDAAHVRPGPESFLGEDRGDPVRFAHAVIDAGADLVVGTGPHVLRGLEWYQGRLIAYSLGSFAGYRTLSIDGPLGVSAVLRVTLEADGSLTDGDLAAVRLVGNGTPEPDPTGSARSLVSELSRADFGDAAVQVSPDGSLHPPGRS